MTTLPLTESQVYDRQALIEIYEAFSPAIYRYAVRLLGDQDLAEDCVSETFSRFLKSLDRGLQMRDNTRAYLYKVAHNWITDFYRRQPPPVHPLDVAEVVDEGSNPSVLAAERLERERVRLALLHLPNEQQMVLQLRFLEDWPHDEVAALMGKTVDATRALQHRALAALRRLLVDIEEKDE